MPAPPVQDSYKTRVVATCTVYSGESGVLGAEVTYQIGAPTQRYTKSKTSVFGGTAPVVDDDPDIAVTPYTITMASAVVDRKEDGLLIVKVAGVGKVKVRAEWTWSLMDFPGEAVQRWNARNPITQVHMEKA